MKIQDYIKVLQAIAKVEEKCEQYNYRNQVLDSTDARENYIAWETAYMEERKAAKALKKAYKDYRKAVAGIEDLSFYCENTHYRLKSDPEFYKATRWKVIEESRHIDFSNEHPYFI